MEKRERFDGLDGIRAYAILGIVLMHVLENGGYQKNGFILQRFIPSLTNLVFLFMMVSAFGMCCGYYERIRNRSISVDQFYSKRYEKIWPYFTLLCALDVAISPSVNAVYELFADLTLCFSLLPNANISVIGVGWTLGVIFVFYMLFPFFCYLLGTKKRAWIVFVLAFIFNQISGSYFDARRNNIVFSAVYFVAGGMIYLYRDELRRFSVKYKAVAWLLAVAAAAMYFAVGESTITMLAVGMTLMVYTLGINWGGILLNPFTRFISGISFEIYLCHMLIYRVIEKLHMNYIVNNDVISYMITVAGTIAGAVVFSLAAQMGIEKTKRIFKGIDIF